MNSYSIEDYATLLLGKKMKKSGPRPDVHMLAYDAPRYNDFEAEPVANKRRNEHNEVVNSAQVKLIS
jgi:hypothetical protein